MAEAVKSGVREDIDGSNVKFKLSDDSTLTGIAAAIVQQYVNTLPISNHVVVKQSVDEWPDDARAQVDKAGVDYGRVKHW